jgi:hypothetical protein
MFFDGVFFFLFVQVVPHPSHCRRRSVVFCTLRRALLSTRVQRGTDLDSARSCDCRMRQDPDCTRHLCSIRTTLRFDWQIHEPTAAIRPPCPRTTNMMRQGEKATHSVPITSTRTTRLESRIERRCHLTIESPEKLCFGDFVSPPKGTRTGSDLLLLDEWS